jgi:hypothetical protein
VGGGGSYLEQSRQLGVTVRNVSLGSSRGEGVDDGAQSHQREVDLRAFLESGSSRSGLRRSLRASQVDQVELRTHDLLSRHPSSQLRHQSLLDLDREARVRPTRPLVHVRCGHSPHSVPLLEKPQKIRGVLDDLSGGKRQPKAESLPTRKGL